MAVAGDEFVADALLRALPPDVANAVLTRIPGDASDRLRSRITQPESKPTDLNAALQEFFDLLRIADRSLPEVATAPPPEPKTLSAESVLALQSIPSERLARILTGEPAPAVALVLSCLDTDTAGDLLKRFSPELRAEVSLRLAQMGDRNPQILNHLARAVVEKNRSVGDAPVEPSADERLKSLAQMLRGMPRDDRVKVVQHLDKTDPKLGDRIRSQLYQFEDILRVPDRSVPSLLAEVDMRTLALVLSTAESAIRQKLLAALSSRAKANLQDETQLLGSPSANLVNEAKEKIVAVIRREEEAGKIQLGE